MSDNMETYSTLTPEQLNDALRKIFKEHLKLTYAFMLGFATDLSEDTILVSDGEIKDHKKVIFMKPGSRIHQVFLDLEKAEDIHFERVGLEIYFNYIMMETISNMGKPKHNYCHEDGKLIYDPSMHVVEPTLLPTEVYGRNRFYVQTPIFSQII